MSSLYGRSSSFDDYFLREALIIYLVFSWFCLLDQKRVLLYRTDPLSILTLLPLAAGLGKISDDAQDGLSVAPTEEVEVNE